MTGGDTGTGVAEEDLTGGDVGVTEGSTKDGMDVGVPTSSGVGEGGTPAGAAETQAEKITRLMINNVRFPASQAILININLLP